MIEIFEEFFFFKFKFFYINLENVFFVSRG